MAFHKEQNRKKRWQVWAVAGAGAAVLTLLVTWVRPASPAATIPTAVVTRGVFRDQLKLRGELKASRSIILSAPMRAGQLEIINLVPDGTSVKQGEVVVQFDASQLKENQAEDKSTLATAEAQIRQSEAQGRLNEEQDTTALKTAHYSLESAKLDASKQAILSRIDGEEALLKVSDAQLTLRQAAEKLKMDRASDAAAIVDEKQKRDEAAFNLRQDDAALAQMSLRAPIAGTVTILSHWTPNGVQTFRPGDQAWPGAAVAELPDLSTLYFDARTSLIGAS
jgi:HlyD family secretion protein